MKSAFAHDRKICFERVTQQQAKKIFQNRAHTSKDIFAFQDYLFHEICRIAAELNLPLQCHTGLDLLRNSNALHMRSVIEQHPQTSFVLFHGGYPWLDDVFGLVHNYSNVYADLCWLPIISQTEAEHALYELIEVGTADRICWGCDTRTSEESLGARLAFRHVLYRVLGEKVRSRYFIVSDAKYAASRILFRNAAELYYLPLARLQTEQSN